MEQRPDVLRLDPVEDDSRFSRFKLIGWWDQEKLKRARVLVVGAGALGNEILKNLALLGVGNVFVVDRDVIEDSNLSRSVLFREGDIGRPKAERAAEAVRDIYPDIAVRALRARVPGEVGLGVFRWADIVIAGLDNRETRLMVNRACWKVGTPWIDGAIERLSGWARVFLPPDGPCYECTLSEVDWQVIRARRACSLLSREEMAGGRVPTTPTTGSIIAGIQVQEAVKYLHGLATLSGEGFVFDGMQHDSYRVAYSKRSDCLSHETFGEIVATGRSVRSTRIGDLLEDVRSTMGPKAVLELNVELIRSLRCERCAEEEEVFRPLEGVTEAEGRCPRCGVERQVETIHTLTEAVVPLDRTFAEIGVPPYDILIGRAKLEQTFLAFDADASEALGPLLREP